MRILLLAWLLTGLAPHAQSTTRPAAADVFQSLPGKDAREPGARHDTPHLVLTTAAGGAPAAPGARVSLFVDIVPKPGMHVYAPGQKELMPIALTLEADPAFTAHAPAFPKAETYFFAPLEETQLVYSRPFRIVQAITIATTPAMRERARAAGASMEVTGTVRYQACDARVCYMPQSLPVSWTIALQARGR